MKAHVLALLIVAPIVGALLFATYDYWKPEDPRKRNSITPFGDVRPLIATPETDRMCKEEAGFFVYEKRPADGLTESDPLCDLKCELILLGPDGPLIPYLEYFVTEEGWRNAQPFPGAADPTVRRYLVDGPGWHRFEAAKWGAPNTEAYMHRARSLGGSFADLNDRYAASPHEPIPKEILDEYAYLFGRAIAVTRIDGPSAPYRRQQKERKRMLVLRDTIQVIVEEDSIVDVKSGATIASAVNVYGRYYALNKDGSEYDSPIGAYCHHPMDKDAIGKIFANSSSQ